MCCELLNLGLKVSILVFSLKESILICIMNVHFMFDKKLYRQCDNTAMR